MIIIKKRTRKKIFLYLKFSIDLTKKIVFQVFFDLCLSRKWKIVKIFSFKSNFEYGILAQNPKNKEIEIFLPILLETSLKPNKIKILTDLFYPIEKKKSFQTINLAFIDSDSTIAYYNLNFSLHKASGPLG